MVAAVNNSAGRYNISVNSSRLFGNVSCSLLSGGSDADFCVDATGAGGGNPFDQSLNTTDMHKMAGFNATSDSYFSEGTTVTMGTTSFGTLNPGDLYMEASGVWGVTAPTIYLTGTAVPDSVKLNDITRTTWPNVTYKVCNNATVTNLSMMQCLVRAPISSVVEVVADGWANSTVAQTYIYLLRNNTVIGTSSHSRAAQLNPTPFSMDRIYIPTSAIETVNYTIKISPSGRMNDVNMVIKVTS